ncbi:MAG: inorganic phosphate transporter [Leptolyngbyaceae cyanobacterium SL_5_14]|nr:inorganic phosphate transporter [Leptolyngbyaceae cyanobacterium SL_5_14]
MLFLGLTAALAFYVAWNLGANDVANSMGTSVGSKAVSLRQALAIAGILEFTGAVLFGRNVSKTIATGVVDPARFAADPHVLLLGMTAALVACGIWLQIATAFGLPVASSHAVVGAIAGFGWVAAGTQAVDWHSISIISITWILTPAISGSVSALFYILVYRWILTQANPVQQLYEWIPWLSVALVSVFSAIALPSLFQLPQFQSLPLPSHDLPLLVGAIATTSLTLITWSQLKTFSHKPLSPEQEIQTIKADFPQSESLEPAAFFNPIEKQLARFQFLSACFVAFAHGSNDVGNAVAPLAAIVYIHRTNSIPLADFSVPTWILVLGGVGIVSGLAVFGKNVIKTIGEGIIPLQPSAGFCAELATATTVLLASRLGLPVSTSHALVGAVVGIGLVQWGRSPNSTIQFGTLRQIALAWLITIPAAAGLAIAIFATLQWIQL